MALYRFRQCRREDLPLLLKFIDSYWRKNHILVRSKDILDFQYYNREQDCYDFVLAENVQTGEIDGIRGWIRVAQFDPALAKYDEVWSAVSKVRTDVHNDEIRLLGSYLWRYLDRHKGFGTVGISKMSFAMHTALRHKTCSLSQYFILNPQCKEFRVAIVPIGYQQVAIQDDKSWTIQEINDICTVTDEKVPAVYKPLKSITYLFNRFQMHPVYKYHFYGLYHEGVLKTILVGRFVEINNSRILHIVDVLGRLEDVSGIRSGLIKILVDTDSEYLDFLCFGVDESVFIRMGFEKLNPECGQVVIPNYFEPFLRQNIIINGAYKPTEGGYTMFKADADQDRPS